MNTNIISKELAQIVKQVVTSYAPYAAGYGINGILPSIKIPQDAYFDQTTEAAMYFLVWDNGYHEPCGAIAQSLILDGSPAGWFSRFEAGYKDYLAHQQPMPGTEDSIIWQ